MKGNNAVSLHDTMRINRLARLYTMGKDPSALEQVAELLLMCKNTEEEQTVLFWWNEGTRDYAGSEKRIHELQAELLEMKAQLWQGDPESPSPVR